MTEYIVTAKNLAYPYGTRFKCRPQWPIETGAICLLTVGRRLTIAGYHHDAAGCDWIVQPDLIIRVAGKINIEIWGLVVPLDAAGGFDWTIGSIVLAECMAVIEICDLVLPLAV